SILVSSFQSLFRDMSTPSCSVFLPRHCMIPYEQGKYLLSSNGPFLELFNMENFYECKQAVPENMLLKTRVFPRSPIHHILPLNANGDILAITSEARNDRRIISGCILKRDRILLGGYAQADSIHQLYDYKADELPETMAEVIKDKNEILLLTSTTVLHYRYIFHDDYSFSLDCLRDFELTSILPPKMCTFDTFSPLFIAPSADLEFIVLNMDRASVGASGSPDICLVLARWSKKRWICREFRDNDSAVRCKIIRRLDLAIISGNNFVTLISTSASQHGSKLKEIERFHAAHFTPRELLIWSCRQKVATAFIVSDDGVSMWKVDGEKQTLEMLSIADYDERASREKIKEFDRPNLEKDSAGELMRKGAEMMLNHISKKNKDRVATAAIMFRRTKNAQSCGGLVVAYESGKLDALDKNEYLFPTFIFRSAIDRHPKFESSCPMWETDDETPAFPFSMLIGISDGKPAALNKDMEDIFTKTDDKGVVYHRVASTITTSGSVVAVYYNTEAIGIYLFDLSFEGPNRLARTFNGDIVNCLVAENIIAVVMKSRLSIMSLTNITEGEITYTPVEFDLGILEMEKEERITVMHAQLMNGKDMQLLAFGTSRGRLLYHFIHGTNQTEVKEHVPVFAEEESIVGIKQDTDGDTCTILGSKGGLAQIPIEYFTGDPKDMSAWTRMTTLEHCGRPFIGFLKVRAKRNEDFLDLAMSKSEKNLHLHYVFHTESVLDINLEHYADSPVFARFVEERRDRHIRLFMNIPSRLGDKQPFLFAVDGTLKSPSTILQLLPPSTLASNGPNGAAKMKSKPHQVHVIPCNASGTKVIANVISTRGEVFNWYDLNKRDHLFGCID
ncbi:hypothetical protein PFISCL1PPCAC_11973, partial [Pristionchus fissidentatus]